MRRWTLIPVVALGATALIGCGSAQPTPAASDAVTTTQTHTTKTVHKPVKVAQVKPTPAESYPFDIKVVPGDQPNTIRVMYHNKLDHPVGPIYAGFNGGPQTSQDERPTLVTTSHNQKWDKEDPLGSTSVVYGVASVGAGETYWIQAEYSAGPVCVSASAKLVKQPEFTPKNVNNC
jgi:hypothetical protein